MFDSNFSMVKIVLVCYIDYVPLTIQLVKERQTKSVKYNNRIIKGW